MAAATAGTAAATATEGDSATATATKPKKIRRRRIVKKKQPVETENPESLDMPATGTTPVTSTAVATDAESQKKKDDRPADPFVTETSSDLTPEEEAAINAEFDQYTLGTGAGDKFIADAKTNMSTDMNGSAEQQQQQAAAEQSRFQQQLSGTWNDQVMDNEEALEPVGQLMKMLALLEEEKIASTKRLEEEFRQRAESDEAYYQKQRKLLQEASMQIQLGQGAEAAATVTSDQEQKKV